jgi:2-C-methyl-D-erythritol 4-phosphate cytidylyltransferase
MSSSATETLAEVTMPQMGVSVAEGTITEWRKRPGDWVENDEILVEISTDKVETEVPSPATGRVKEILVEVGETVDVGVVLATIETGATAGEAHPVESTVDSRQSTGFVAGGASRSASVRNALAAAPEASVVVVHDAARPLVERDLVERCIAALDGVDGAIAAARVTDTVKEADPSGRVVRTLDRSALWAVQTPQAFRADALQRALDVDESVLAAATDDASLVEAAGGAVAVVEAPRENIKVTTQLDLRVAEAMLEARC